MLYEDVDLEFLELEKDRTTRAVRRKQTAHKKNHKAKCHKRLPKSRMHNTKKERLNKAILHDAFDHGVYYIMSFSKWLDIEIGIAWDEFDCLYSPDRQNDMFDWYEYDCRVVW